MPMKHGKHLVAAENGRLEIFNPTTDKNAVFILLSEEISSQSYITGEMPGQLILRLAATGLTGDHILGFQHFFADKLKGRIAEAGSFDKLMIRARATGTQPVKAKVILTNADAISVSTYITLTDEF